mgnify:CR=1 FL=1
MHMPHKIMNTIYESMRKIRILLRSVPWEKAGYSQAPYYLRPRKCSKNRLTLVTPTGIEPVFQP